MSPLLKNFAAALVGIVLYKALNFALDPETFDFTAEALEAVVIAVVVTVVLTLFNRRRERRASAS